MSLQQKQTAKAHQRTLSVTPPPFLLTFIFDQLSRSDIIFVSEICKTWHQLSYDPTLSSKWSYLDFTYFDLPLSKAEQAKSKQPEAVMIQNGESVTLGMVAGAMKRAGVQLRRLCLGMNGREVGGESAGGCSDPSLSAGLFGLLTTNSARLINLTELSISPTVIDVPAFISTLKHDPSFLPSLKRLHVSTPAKGIWEAIQDLVPTRPIVTDLALCQNCQGVTTGRDCGVDTCNECDGEYCEHCLVIDRCVGYADCEVKLCSDCTESEENGKHCDTCGKLYCRGCWEVEDIQCPECQNVRCSLSQALVPEQVLDVHDLPGAVFV
ncbi:hypothetical protein HDV00_003175 [Rhizophlyctis rosea]|nr:hypothetical protein HDV00_003175 [Rhizophlyctis rosea]